MAAIKTLLFTTYQPSLFAELQKVHADVAPLVIGSTVPPLDPASEIWCFIDFLLPDLSGIEMCRRLRSDSTTRHANITMIFESLDASLITRALNIGADDYAIAPLQTKDVVNRISLPAARKPSADERIEIGHVVIEPNAHRVRYMGQRVELAPNEFNLLLHLAQRPDRVLSRPDIIRLIGKPTEEIDDRTVDVWIGRLRKAFKAAGAPDFIRTVRPLGYMLETA